MKHSILSYVLAASLAAALPACTADKTGTEKAPEVKAPSKTQAVDAKKAAADAKKAEQEAKRKAAEEARKAEQEAFKK